MVVVGGRWSSQRMERSQGMQQHGSQRPGLQEEGNDQQRHMLLRG